jgi:tRNA threonylcarbamoyladenosine biosynthesis protein TsaE
LQCASPSPESTRALGVALGRAADRGLAVALLGSLGAGKTLFAQGVAEGLGLDPRGVQSPTFVIACEYPLPPRPAGGSLRRLVHADLYRLERPEEAEAAGLRDWLGPDTLLLVEWADRAPEALPDDRLEIRIGGGPEGRVLEIEARGAAAEAVLSRWRSVWL